MLDNPLTEILRLLTPGPTGGIPPQHYLAAYTALQAVDVYVPAGTLHTLYDSLTRQDYQKAHTQFQALRPSPEERERRLREIEKVLCGSFRKMLGEGWGFPSQISDGLLVVKKITGEGQKDYVKLRLSPQGEILVGRTKNSLTGFYLDSSAVSNLHAKIYFSNECYWLEDKHSTNGTFIVSDEKWHRIQGPIRLEHGQFIKFADITVQIFLPEEHRIEEKRASIASCPDLASLINLLRDIGVKDTLRTLGDTSSGTFEERRNRMAALTNAGGLSEKARELMMIDGFRRINPSHSRFPSEQHALADLLQMTESVLAVQSLEDLGSLVRQSQNPAFKKAGAAIVDYLSGQSIDMEQLPDWCGVRKRFRELSMERMALGDAEIGALREICIHPDILIERPWEGCSVSPQLKRDLEELKPSLEVKLSQPLSLGKDPLYAFEDPQEEQDEQGTFLQVYEGYGDPGKAGTMIVSAEIEDRVEDFYAKLQESGLRFLPGVRWIYGGSSKENFKHEGRLYLRPTLAHAIESWKYLTKVFYPEVLHWAQDPVSFKMSRVPARFQSGDPVVLYFSARDSEAVFNAVDDMEKDCQNFLQPGRPRFTRPVRGHNGRELKGVSFGQNPKIKSSFGEIRSLALQRAIRVARLLKDSGENINYEGFGPFAAFFLEEAGVDPEYPVFNLNGRQKFRSILSRIVL